MALLCSLIVVELVVAGMWNMLYISRFDVDVHNKALPVFNGISAFKYHICVWNDSRNACVSRAHKPGAMAWSIVYPCGMLPCGTIVAIC